MSRKPWKTVGLGAMLAAAAGLVVSAWLAYRPEGLLADGLVPP